MLITTQRVLFLLGLILLTGCAHTSHFTATVYQDQDRVVRLMYVPNANDGRGYAHPAQLDETLMDKVLSGILVGTGNPDPEKAYAPVFTEHERKQMARLLSRGLREAGQMEVVTFVQVTPASSWQERVTSGGVFVEGDKLHFILANFQVKQAHWQDIEQYDAPIETLPLEPVENLPREIIFRPSDAVAEPGPAADDFDPLFGRAPWHIAIRYKKL